MVGDLVESAADPVDQPADVGDLVVGGHRVGAGPAVEVGCGQQPFTAGEQVVEATLQVGQIGHVGAEVVATHPAEPERAGGAASGDGQVVVGPPFGGLAQPPL